MEITGGTRICAILADPVHHVRTPEAFNRLMATWQADVVLVPLHVASDDLFRVTDAIRGMSNVSGFIATVPHKTAMATLCDEISPAARLVGAVNAVRRTPEGLLIGEILDGLGFVRGLEASDVGIYGKSVFLAGAGGAASAIAFALAEAGISRLGIWNRTTAKANELRARLRSVVPDLETATVGADPFGYDIVINATSLGLEADDRLPLDATRLGSGQTVAEIIMKPVWTPLLRTAEARGCRIVFGAPMLDCQLTLMAEFMGIRR